MTKILVVEDSRSELDLITLYLENNSYQVISANNAEDGMELAAKQQPEFKLSIDVKDGGSHLLSRFCRRYPISITIKRCDRVRHLSHNKINPIRIPIATASVRVETPNFWKMDEI